MTMVVEDINLDLPPIITHRLALHGFGNHLLSTIVFISPASSARPAPYLSVGRRIVLF